MPHPDDSPQPYRDLYEAEVKKRRALEERLAAAAEALRRIETQMADVRRQADVARSLLASIAPAPALHVETVRISLPPRPPAGAKTPRPKH